ncbi:MAG: ABC transporter permease [Clostridiales bacterium]|nr:ABC transporter permease [Clostridiales bacterium]
MERNPSEKRARSLSTSLMLLIILAVMFVLLGLRTEKFLSIGNIQNLFRQTAIYGVIAIGMTFVIMSGGIDLSVGAVVGLSGVLSSMFMSDQLAFKWSIPASIIVAVAATTLIGLINGVIIFDGKVPPFIATLGLQIVVRGTIMLITNAQMVSGISRAFRDFSTLPILGFPALGWIWLGIAALSMLAIKYTTFGRNVFAIGSNTEAARLSGINIRLTTYGVYIVCSFLCSVAGVMMTARLGNGVPTGGIGYETDAIAAAVVGGASLSGAEGSIIGTVLGSLIMATLRNGGNLIGINSHLQEILIGLLIVLAVLLDKRRRK